MERKSSAGTSTVASGLGSEGRTTRPSTQERRTRSPPRQAKSSFSGLNRTTIISTAVRRTSTPVQNKTARDLNSAASRDTRISTAVKRKGTAEQCESPRVGIHRIDGGRTTRSSTAVKRTGTAGQSEELSALINGGVSWKEYLPVLFHLYGVHLSPSFRRAAVPPPPRKPGKTDYKLLRFLDDGFRHERIRRSSFQPAEGSTRPAPDAQVPNRRWSMAVPAAGQLDPHGESHVPDTGPGYLITPALLSRLQRLHRSTSRGVMYQGDRRLSTLSSVSDDENTDNENSRRPSVVIESDSSNVTSRRPSVSSSLVGAASRRPSLTPSMVGPSSRRGSVAGPTGLGSRRGSLVGTTGIGPPSRRGSVAAPVLTGSVSRRGSLLVYHSLYEEPYINSVDAMSTDIDREAGVPLVTHRNRQESGESKSSSGSESGTRRPAVINTSGPEFAPVSALLIRRKSGLEAIEQGQILDVTLNSGSGSESGSVEKVPVSVVKPSRTGRTMTKLSLAPPARRSRRASLFY